MDFLTPYLNMAYVAPVAIGLAILIVGILIYKALSGPVMGRKGQRLGISEYHEIDKTRRLVLVRRDETEHLILIGGAQDVVIESGISLSNGAEELHFGKWSRPRQLAYWINAYNAFVLQTVIDHYPIRGRSSEYPPNSIRQIPGAFERQTFRAGGKTVTLDGLERDVIAALGDPRALLALGRGAIGSSRLKSEAYSETRLDAQLGEMTREIVMRREMVEVNAETNVLSVSPMFSWREAVFSALADRAPAIYASRSPLERAVLALIDPVIVPNEAVFLKKNQFRMIFHDFDWKLNDLTGRGR